MHPAERETIITMSDADDLVHIWTSQRRTITKLRKSAKYAEISSGTFDGHPWACFTIPADRWNPVTGAKRSHNPASGFKSLNTLPDSQGHEAAPGSETCMEHGQSAA